jgi:hypothetical protein
MAGNKVKKGKLRASSTLEAVVSMVIILIVFTMAMSIYANVLRWSVSVKKIRAGAILQEVLQQTDGSTFAGTQTLQVDGFRIEQEIKVMDGEQRLSAIKVTAFDENQQKVAEVQQLIFRKDEQ